MLGLVLPALTGVAPLLTPVAASGLVLLMIGAAIIHTRRREWGSLTPVVLLGAMAAVVAWGWFGDWPLWPCERDLGNAPVVIGRTSSAGR